MRVNYRGAYFVPGPEERDAIELLCKRKWLKAIAIYDRVIAKNPDRAPAIQAQCFGGKMPFDLFMPRYVDDIRGALERYVAAKKAGEKWPPPLPACAEKAHGELLDIHQLEQELSGLVAVEKSGVRRRHKGQEYIRLSDG